MTRALTSILGPTYERYFRLHPIDRILISQFINWAACGEHSLKNVLLSFFSGGSPGKNMKRQTNPFLRQGDEEVNKRINQKNICLNKLPNISV